MSIKAYRILESAFINGANSTTMIKEISHAHSFYLGGVCDDLVDYNTLDDCGSGEISINVGAIIDFLAGNPTSKEWNNEQDCDVITPLDPDVKAALLDDIKGKDRADDVQYECM